MKRLPVLAEMVGFWRCYGCRESFWGPRKHEENSCADYCPTCFGQKQFRELKERYRLKRKR
ncbi:hypothetical protein [Ammoniphilus sp. 3BR4]|uniref:hypothetical protein n=1 Tax=Ammoniphilus sp. 3BR4 TaxID=3158265 RepID=UPI003467193B